MKKGIFVIIILLAVLSQVFTPTFAAVIDKGPISNLPIESVGTKTGTLVQPTGIKSWVARTVLLRIVSNIRSTAYSVMQSRIVSWFTTASFRNTVASSIQSIANYIEAFAMKMDTVTQYSYQILRDLVSQALAKMGINTSYADSIAKFIEQFFL